MAKGSGSLRASAYMKGVFSMTNEQIILFNRIQLMKDGVIGTTGNQICIEDEEGNKEVIYEPEQIHTFMEWKRRGFSVKKGEKAIAQFTIWKHVTKKAKAENEEDEEKMFMKQAFFFSAEQVEAIEQKQVV
jgi:hypothetical protein